VNINATNVLGRDYKVLAYWVDHDVNPGYNLFRNTCHLRRIEWRIEKN